MYFATKKIFFEKKTKMTKKTALENVQIWLENYQIYWFYVIILISLSFLVRIWKKFGGLIFLISFILPPICFEKKQ